MTQNNIIRKANLSRFFLLTEERMCNRNGSFLVMNGLKSSTPSNFSSTLKQFGGDDGLDDTLRKKRRRRGAQPPRVPRPAMRGNGKRQRLEDANGKQGERDNTLQWPSPWRRGGRGRWT